MSRAHNFSAATSSPHQRPDVAAGTTSNETEGRDATATPGVDEPRHGSSGADPMAGTAERVAHEVAETIRDGVTPPLNLSIEDRMAALELECTQLRLQARLLGESLSRVLDSAS